MQIIAQLAPHLPDGFVAEPRVHLGSYYEIDVSAYEVLVFDLERERRLVAAIEIVSPANKDRPESRQLFVAKCLNLLRQDVCVAMIDLVTIRQFSLYGDLLTLIGHADAISQSATPIYAATCRKRAGGWRTKVDTWFFPLAIGQPLPMLPIWLTERLSVQLDLEASYEETCRLLRIA